MSDALFTEADVYSGDPLRPDTETPTPAEVVGSLTGSQRRQRVEWLSQQAHDLYDAGVAGVAEFVLETASFELAAVEQFKLKIKTADKNNAKKTFFISLPLDGEPAGVLRQTK